MAGRPNTNKHRGRYPSYAGLTATRGKLTRRHPTGNLGEDVRDVHARAGDVLETLPSEVKHRKQFSAIKRKFGDAVRSKTEVACRNEVLEKVVCHNLVVVVHEMHELGIDPGFTVESPRTDLEVPRP